MKGSLLLLYDQCTGVMDGRAGREGKRRRMMAPPQSVMTFYFQCLFTRVFLFVRTTQKTKLKDLGSTGRERPLCECCFRCFIFFKKTESSKCVFSFFFFHIFLIVPFFLLFKFFFALLLLLLMTCPLFTLS